LLLEPVRSLEVGECLWGVRLVAEIVDGDFNAGEAKMELDEEEEGMAELGVTPPGDANNELNNEFGNPPLRPSMKNIK